jgi:hypothetical protein
MRKSLAGLAEAPWWLLDAFHGSDDAEEAAWQLDITIAAPRTEPHGHRLNHRVPSQRNRE